VFRSSQEFLGVLRSFHEFVSIDPLGERQKFEHFTLVALTPPRNS
jgi:hypothetical protein